MAIGEPAAIGVDRKGAAGAGPTAPDELLALAVAAESERLQRHQHGDGEAVVKHGEVDFGRAAPRHGVGPARGLLGDLELRHVRHVRNARMRGGGAVPQHMDRRGAQVARAFLGGHHHGAAAVGDQAAVVAPERRGDHPRAQHIVHRHGLAECGGGVERGPGAGRRGDFGKRLAGRAIDMGVALRRHRIGADRERQPGRNVPLVREHRRAPAQRPRRLALLERAVNDQHRFRLTGADRLGRPPCMEHEGCAADIGAVEIARPFEPQIFRQQHRLHGARPRHAPHAGDGEAVHVAHGQPCLAERFARRVSLYRKDRRARQRAAPFTGRRVGDTDDDRAPAHASAFSRTAISASTATAPSPLGSTMNGLTSIVSSTSALAAAKTESLASASASASSSEGGAPRTP